MAFFKFRKGGDRQSATTVHPESVEAMRRRAKHRLIGSAVLILAGVIGFPLIFDTQPRPIAVDVPIVIPDKNSVKPLALPAVAAPTPPPSVVAAATPTESPAVAATQAAATTAKPSRPESVPATAALSPKEEIITTPKAPAVVSPKPPVVAAAPKPAPAPAPAPKADDGAKARALLEGKTPPASAAASAAPTAPTAPAATDSGRFVVQVGAFADADKAREARMKVERSGLKTYTQVADTKDGKRTRVRVGPFTSKAEADRAASKIKALDLSAAVLTL